MRITRKRPLQMTWGVLLVVLLTLAATPAGAAPPTIKFSPPGIGGGDPTPPSPGQAQAPAPAQSQFPATPSPAGLASLAPGTEATPLAVEQRLNALHYNVGAVDGVVDAVTNSAVMAFQKVTGMERTGQLTDPAAAAILATTTDPAPLVPGGEPHRVEIDLGRQVLLLYEGGALTWIVPVSSGKPSTPTVRGSFRIYKQVAGWETSRYGRLYNSQYFVGGYAIHGSLSVPNYPASHGCVRIPMSAADILPGRLSIGTQVFVLG